MVNVEFKKENNFDIILKEVNHQNYNTKTY